MGSPGPPPGAPPGSGTSGTLLPSGAPTNYTPQFAESPYPPQSTDSMSSQFPGGGMLTNINSLPNANAYKPGDEWAPANNPEEILPLQEALVNAGMLTAADVRPGVWDATSAAAYKSALELSNYYGASVQDTLQMLSTNPKVGTQKSADTGLRKYPFAQTAPETISAEVSTLNGANTAQNMLGQNLDAGQTADFVKFYQGKEAAARKQYMAADMQGPGNFYIQAPTLTSAAQDYIKSHDLTQAVAYGTAQRALQFFSMLKGAGGTGASL